ncbi:MAG: hypothetical protein K0U98_10425 [Deltaproteobacteria bacterium]|nr:hypothetical protein [Deltaproteobacteria bacterium]
MVRALATCILAVTICTSVKAGEVIPFDPELWEIRAKAHVLEHYRGRDAIYIHQGTASLKGVAFTNGTIEFDVFLTERQAFPGVYFRQVEGGNQESFFLRPHLSGKPDANQAAPSINGLVPWQLYFGETYSFPYDYNYEDWTHVKVVVNGSRAQVYLDYAEKPNLSWNLKHPPRAGGVSIGGGFAPMHYAGFTIDEKAVELVDFAVEEPEPVPGLIQEWSISGQFDETELEALASLEKLISRQRFEHTISVEENNAANISWVAARRSADGKRLGNTVFARLTIDSKATQTKIFDFGYSDRVVVILNGRPLYRGNNKWRSRDYRYLGTIGLFDAVYLDLRKGENTLLLAVSEDFGGWGVTGRFRDPAGVDVRP